MKNEYKNCPKCHIINAPNAVKCECGYVFSTDECLTDSQIRKSEKKKKHKNFALSCGIVLLIAVFALLSSVFGFLYVALFSVALIAILMLILKIVSAIKSSRDVRRLGE